MNRKHIYLVRHGESLGNIGFQATWDSTLSPNGRLQASFCANFLQRETSGDAQVFSSPFLRCLQTAQFISDKIPGGLTIEPLLHEFYSENLFPGKTRFPSLKEIASSFPGVKGDFNDSDWMPQKYESSEDISIRAAILRNSILAQDGRLANSSNNTILVSHWAFIATLAQTLCSEKMDTVSNCSVTKISMEAGKFRAEYINNTSFIDNNHI
ncbi:MAG TPA: histidine phosphatase family protein [Victivallales bacterium]|nr:histidine phosphatase family protein [Victivallales bacterium]